MCEATKYHENKSPLGIGTCHGVGYVFCMTKNASPVPSLDWCLFLDVDGTLLELTDTPSGTAADQGLKSLLKEVAERLGGAVALVSGRSIAYLDALFAPLKLPAAGLHGVERRKASGAIQGANYSDAQLDGARAGVALTWVSK